MPTGIAPVKQALVKALRDHAALKAAVSNEIHEAVAPVGVDYPFVIYQVASSVSGYYWGGMGLRVSFDVFVISDDQVEAHNLDQYVIDALHDKDLDLGASGQSTLYCRRVRDLSSVELDESGQKIYEMGGLHEVWTDQTTA